jgi:histone H3/H4
VISLAEEFTLAPIRRLFKKQGDLRVSEGAAEELRRAIGKYGLTLAETAISISTENGRKTVLERDVIAAIQVKKSGVKNDSNK